MVIHKHCISFERFHSKFHTKLFKYILHIYLFFNYPIIISNSRTCIDYLLIKTAHHLVNWQIAKNLMSLSLLNVSNYILQFAEKYLAGQSLLGITQEEVNNKRVMIAHTLMMFEGIIKKTI